VVNGAESGENALAFYVQGRQYGKPEPCMAVRTTLLPERMVGVAAHLN